MNTTASGSGYQHSERRPHTAAFLHPPIVALVKEFGIERVLDIGCGNGTLAAVMSQAGCRVVVGCDPSESGIQIARQSVPTGKFYQAGVYDDPAQIDEEEFDAAIATEVIEHLFYPRALPRFAHAKLRPGGRLILSTPYHGYLKNLALSMANHWDAHHTALWDGGHIKFWSRQSLTRLLDEEGFVFERFIGCGRLPYLWMSMILVARKR